MSTAFLSSDDRRSNFVWSIGLAGSVPLWIAAVLMWSHADPVSAGRAVAIAIAYAAVVLAFLGGSRWGSAIAIPSRPLFYRERAMSIVPGLAGLAALFLPPAIALTLLVSMFLWQALWDVTSAEDGRLPYWSGMVRATLTAISVPALLAMLGRVLFAA
ncbi:MAG: DUF3429 family protein [Rhizobiales bacterium]|nr:DUF3429 family protein [Hyphomicrobiales bacterium]